jgi:hypothetical protein
LAHRLAGLRAAVDAHQHDGDQPDQQPGGDPGDLDGEPAAVGGRPVDEQRDDRGRGDQRAQQPEGADLAVPAEVTVQHHDEDDEVDDQFLGERGHRLVPV